MFVETSSRSSKLSKSSFYLTFCSSVQLKLCDCLQIIEVFQHQKIKDLYIEVFEKPDTTLLYILISLLETRHVSTFSYSFKASSASPSELPEPKARDTSLQHIIKMSILVEGQRRKYLRREMTRCKRI